MNKNKEEFFVNQLLVKRTDMSEEQQEILEKIVNEHLK